MSALRNTFSLVLPVFLALSLISTKESQGKPVYNPQTKSYFELRNDLFGNNHGWTNAKQAAEKLQFKGVRGRLAVVDSLQTHQFLVKNFNLEAETWIGLRFWCKYKKLQWVNGKIHPRDAFNHWDPRWYRYYGSSDPNLQFCRTSGTIESGYMPVYYLPAEKGYRWQAVGSAKGFRHYLVEFPTGGE